MIAVGSVLVGVLAGIWSIMLSILDRLDRIAIALESRDDD